MQILSGPDASISLRRGTRNVTLVLLDPRAAGRRWCGRSVLLRTTQGAGRGGW